VASSCTQQHQKVRSQAVVHSLNFKLLIYFVFNDHDVERDWLHFGALIWLSFLLYLSRRVSQSLEDNLPLPRLTTLKEFFLTYMLQQENAGTLLGLSTSLLFLTDFLDTNSISQIALYWTKARLRQNKRRLESFSEPLTKL